jgi:nicotinamidase-related amidase
MPAPGTVAKAVRKRLIREKNANKEHSMDEHERVMDIIRLKSQAPVVLDRDSTALLVIDMQRDFIYPDHEFAQVLERIAPGVTEGYFERVRSAVVPNVQRLLAAFRNCGAPVFFTGTGTQVSDGQDLCCWLRDFDALGMQVLGKRVWPRIQDRAWQIDEAVAPQPGEAVVNKTAADPLGCTIIDQSLRNLRMTTVVVAGLTTDVCVSSTARSCADRGYRTILAEDACTTLSARMHEASLDIFRLAFGQVKTTEELLAALTSAAASRAGL